MTRTLTLLALASAAFLVIGVVAALLNFTIGVVLVGLGVIAVLAAAVWMLVRGVAGEAAGKGV